MEVGEVFQRPNLSSRGLVVHDGRSHEHPIKIARPDDLFLPVLIRVDVAQKQRVDQSVKQEPAMSDAVAGADAGDRYEASNSLGIHRLDQCLRGRGEQRYFAEGTGRRAERAHHHILPFESAA